MGFKFLGISGILVDTASLKKRFTGPQRLPRPEAEALFQKFFRPNLWEKGLEEIRRAIKSETPQTLSELGACVFTDVLLRSGRELGYLSVPFGKTEFFREFICSINGPSARFNGCFNLVGTHRFEFGAVFSHEWQRAADAFSHPGPSTESLSFRWREDLFKIYDRAVQVHSAMPEGLAQEIALVFIPHWVAADEPETQFTMGDNISTLNAALQSNPASLTHRLQRGLLHQTNGNHQKAITDFNHILKKEPDHKMGRYARGISLFDSGDSKGAIRDLDHAVKLDPAFTEALCFRGYIYEQLGKLKKAEADYSRAIERDQTGVYGYIGRGSIRFKKHDWSGALSDFTKAIGLNPHDPDVYCYRGEVFAAQKKYPQAVAEYTTSLNMAPDNYEVYLSRGTALLELNLAHLARADFEQALKLAPKKWDKAKFARAALIDHLPKSKAA